MKQWHPQEGGPSLSGDCRAPPQHPVPLRIGSPVWSVKRRASAGSHARHRSPPTPTSITRAGVYAVVEGGAARTDESGFKVSRRAVLRVGVGMLAALIPLKAGAQPKIAQKLVQYQQKPKGPQECDNCLHVIPPRSCKMVEGKINPKAGASSTPRSRSSLFVDRPYEGIVAKDPESRYVPDRTLSWLKVRQRDYRKQRVVVDHEDESLRDTRAAA
jgi:hypothetical protein